MIPDDQLYQVAQSFGCRSFSTYDFVQALKQLFPLTWEELEERYGRGGQGAGAYYSAFTRVAQCLNVAARHGDLDKLDYRPAPKGWGNPIIRYWALRR